MPSFMVSGGEVNRQHLVRRSISYQPVDLGESRSP